MARITLRAGLWRLAAALRIPALALLIAGVAGAQSATVSGKVTSEAGQPIAGANVRVSVSTQTYGGIANANGVYTFVVPADAAKGQEALVSARFIGYTPISKTVRLTAPAVTVDFVLKTDPFRLSDVVVTGVASETSLNKVPFSITKVSEDQISAVPASSPIASLSGKVSGARIEIGSGEPGAAPTIRLRGSTNLGVGNSAPIILIDGVITKYSIADIDASDIESIEVLKGAAAASFYGSDAANGVINISTKRGKGGTEGVVQVRTRSEIGTSGVEHFVERNKHHYYVLNPDGSFKVDASGARTIKADGIMDNPYPSSGPDMWRDQLKTWLKPGNFYTNNVQVSMKRGSTNFAASFTGDHDQGVLPLINGYFRQTARLNIDQAISSKIDISTSVTYGTNNYDYDPAWGSDNNPWFNIMQAPPDVDLLHPNPVNTTVPYFPLIPPAKSPGARANPLYNLSVNQVGYDRERVLGSGSVRYRPFEWLKLDASYGTDRSNRRKSRYIPKGSLNAQGLPTPGYYYLNSSNDIAENSQVNAVASRLWFSNLATTTRVSYLVEKFHELYFRANGSKLMVSSVPDLAALDPTVLSLTSTNDTRNTINYMVSQAFDYKDRYVLDLLYRKDGSSLFGPEARWADFYRVATTYRLTEDFKIPGVQELRVRAAQGTAGLRPAFADQYESYDLVNGQFSKDQMGNKALKPAIQTEKEFGLNMQFLNRFDLELVNAGRRTVGAFLAVPLSPAQSGGFLTQVRNAATVTANTWEFSLQSHLYDSQRITWSMGITADHTTQKIEKLGRAAFRVNAVGAQGQDVFFYKEGEPLGIIYGQKWVRNPQQLLDNPVNKANAAFALTDYVINSDGYVVAKARLGTNTEAPIAYVDGTGNNSFVIGDVNPDFTYGISNTVRFRNFNLYALFDGVQGGDIYNFTKHWMFQDERNAVQDQSARPQADKRPAAFYAALYNGLNAHDAVVEKGTFLKLKELSLSYTVSSRVLEATGLNRIAKGAKIALIGRNLMTWTKYSGFDPEVTSGSDFNFRIDGFQYPNFRKITGQFELTF